MGEPTSQENLSREEAIFHAAVQLRDPAKRAIYLDMACEKDPSLRMRLEKLLANDTGESFLAQPLAKASLLTPADPPPDVSRPEPPAAPVQGERIGRYQLIQKIGEGGCGVVYMAEQEEPVRRRVALKVIKLGMDSKQVVARFEAERQAL